MGFIEQNRDLLPYAKYLRKNMTKQEKHLWYDFLSKHRLKWYRQRIIGSYIVDFYCSKLKLVIEIDGRQHLQKNNLYCDNVRTLALQQEGIYVLRFMNSDVDYHFDYVCNEIEKNINERLEKCMDSISKKSPL